LMAPIWYVDSVVGRKIIVGVQQQSAHLRWLAAARWICSCKAASSDSIDGNDGMSMTIHVNYQPVSVNQYTRSRWCWCCDPWIILSYPKLGELVSYITPTPVHYLASSHDI
jgi:hypothetical protein